MNRRAFLARGMGLGLTAMGSAISARGNGDTARRPNIIVIFTDDQGYADLGCQGQNAHVRTPHIDRLAREGIRFTDGYVTAPQCSPSRAGLVTGRYQQRFGLDDNARTPLPLTQTTLAERLRRTGYTTGMVGKWHLEPKPTSVAWAEANLEQVERTAKGRVRIPPKEALRFFPDHFGFSEYFKGPMHRYYASYTLDGEDTSSGTRWLNDKRLRIDVQSDAAVTFIERNHRQPFFLYVAYFAPHTPLEATDEYFAGVSRDLPERRRHALAMLAAVDSGVGRILDTLDKHGISEDTLLFFISDNGAPLKLTTPDTPVGTDAGGWDGSLNTPWAGEKGMLTEGGIRVPFLARWKGNLPAGRVCSEPVSSLDVAATATALAGLDTVAELDGVNLLPYMRGEATAPPRDALYWRFWNQAAIRQGRWKYLEAGGAARFLFDLSNGAHETKNLIAEHPALAERLREKLAAWAAELKDPGIPAGPLNSQERQWYAHYLGWEPGAG